MWKIILPSSQSSPEGGLEHCIHCTYLAMLSSDPPQIFST